jgi:hypothetical protein
MIRKNPAEHRGENVANAIRANGDARLGESPQSGREQPGYVKGGTTVFEVLHEPRTYNVYRFE